MFALNIALLLVCAAAVQGEEQKQCDYSDSECMIVASNRHFGKAIEGQEGKWEGSEPLNYPELIENKTDSLEYSFSDISITGFSKCKTTYLSLTSDFSWSIECSELIASFNYKLKGTFDDFSLDGEGTGQHDMTNYGIKWFGAYSTPTKDGDSYLQIGDTQVSYVNNGVHTYKLDGMSEEQNEFINKNAETVNEVICKNTLTTVLKAVFIPHINEFLAANPMKDLFYSS